MAKVLVVDDSLSVRKVVERALVSRQIEVVCAATGSEALERIERDEPDVVVCDVVMPDRDGYEICDFVKRHPRLAGTPVLLMSGIVNDEVRERAARVQSADVLSKPYAADDLLRKLEGLMAAPPSTPASPSLVAAPIRVNGNGHTHVHAPAPVDSAPVVVAPTAPVVLPPPFVANVEPRVPAVTTPKRVDITPRRVEVTPRSMDAAPRSMEASPVSPRVP